MCWCVFVYMDTCMDEDMYWQTDALSKLGKQYSEDKFLKMI